MIRRGKCELPTASSLLRIYTRLKSWDCLLWKHRPPAGHSLGKMLIGTSQRWNSKHHFRRRWNNPYLYKPISSQVVQAGISRIRMQCQEHELAPRWMLQSWNSMYEAMPETAAGFSRAHRMGTMPMDISKSTAQPFTEVRKWVTDISHITLK